MVQVSYPGVYIQEVPSGVHTITGVSTSIAAFLGRTSKGPINKAVPIPSLAEYARRFGDPHPKSDLADSVRLFFANGGTNCYVVRLAEGAETAKLTLQDIDNNNVLVVSAKNAGKWGNGVKLEVDYDTTNPDETFNLRVIHMDGETVVARELHSSLSMDPNSPRFAPAFVTQSSSLINIELHADAAEGGGNEITDLANSFEGYSQSRPFSRDPNMSIFRDALEPILLDTPKFDINVDDEGYVPIDLSTVLGPAAPAIAPGPGSTWTRPQMASRIKDVINEQLNAAIPGVAIDCTWAEAGTKLALRIIADSGEKRSVYIKRSTEDDFAVPMMLGLDQKGLEPVRYSSFRPVPTAAFFNDVDEIINLAALSRDAITSIQIDGGTNVLLDFSAMSAAAGDLWFADCSGNANGIREKLQYIAQEVNDAATVPWRAEVWGYHLAFTIADGSINTTASGVVSGGDAVLGNDFEANVRRYTLGTSGTSTYQLPGTPPDIGIDGNAPTHAEFLGNEEKQTGFHALDVVDLFNLMVIPGDDEVPEATYLQIWGPASNYCERNRAFLIIDPPKNWVDSDGRPDVVFNPDLIKDLRAPVVNDHAAVFYPRLRYVSNGLKKTIGPAGALAGLMARIDSSRGVWKAPAGLEASLQGIVELELELTDNENGMLNKQGVNCLRVFPNGFVNWGARTLDGADDFGSEWKYIPVRRMALFLEESLFRGTKWVVFEPNGESLWAKIRLNLNAFMMGLFRQGAFQGSTPDKAFYVKCDGETTTQADRNLGIVNIEVGFAPLKPAEFVVIKIQQIAGDL